MEIGAGSRVIDVLLRFRLVVLLRKDVDKRDKR